MDTSVITLLGHTRPIYTENTFIEGNNVNVMLPNTVYLCVSVTEADSNGDMLFPWTLFIIVYSKKILL